MRLRLIIAMLVVVGITIASVVGFAMVTTVREVNVYMTRGGMYGLNGTVTTLETFYRNNGTWEGAKQAFNNSNGMMINQTGSGMGMASRNNEVSNPDPNPGNLDNPPLTNNLVLADTNGNILAIIRGHSGLVKLSSTQIKNAISLKQDNGTVIGFLYTDAGAPIQPGYERPLMQRLYGAVQKGAYIGIAIAILLSLVLGYWFLKPVQQLTKAANALGKGDLSQRVKASGNDELAQLGKTFNNMAESLQKAEEMRKSMTADIAHELRTPLSVQRATIEAMVDGVYELNEENLKPVMEQNVLLARLVDDLRTLALADAGELTLEKVETDVVRLSNNVLARFRTQADKNQVELDFHADENIPNISADPIRLEQILTNLMGNALRYAPKNGHISIQVKNEETAISISVHDSGPGIPPESLPYVFDRFYRVAKSRNREEGGSGLGLAIARQLARSHNGDLVARNHPDGGAEFTLSLPITA
jgi:two-component system, OmpR family, sensor histidine kinase BaeS